MLEILLGASGGLFGILGALVKQGIEAYQKTQDTKNQLEIIKAQNAHELLMADKNLEQLKFEATNNLNIAQLNSLTELEKSANTVFNSSFDHDKATYSNDPTNGWMVFVDVVRGLIRPSITLWFALALWAFTFYIWMQTPDTVKANPKFLETVLDNLINALIFIGSTVILWWFAERPTRKPNALSD